MRAAVHACVRDAAMLCGLLVCREPWVMHGLGQCWWIRMFVLGSCNHVPSGLMPKRRLQKPTAIHGMWVVPVECNVATRPV